MTIDQVSRYTTEELKKLEKSGGDKTDWQRVHHMTDEKMFSKAIAPQRKKTEVKLCCFGNGAKRISRNSQR